MLIAKRFPEEEPMSEIQVTARLKIHDGKRCCRAGDALRHRL